ncbi:MULTISPECIES: TIGR03943 family protein [Cryobacterium]|uniref:TIGR03943 family protein n=1 Tax=Cryobacterium breve TaxID=1259258 RepID=A0ABY2IVX1_9MICO|nr:MULTISPECIES: TIGR03943 family protein [Cryobacterium]TFC93085.1 TIGR03943 family protein [Cryobacterium sp. TmT3-12]TFC96070.1 TIGR03943 family protein [Cryobacterium breve]
MPFRRLLRRWQGALLSVVGIVATVWLGFSGQLGLYIHPRYFVFTLVMAFIAGVLVVVAFALLPATEHEHALPDDDQGRWAWLWSAGSILLIASATVGLLVLPPATLTTATVAKRDLNGSTSNLTQSEASDLVGGDYSSFTVRDWSSLLRQGAGEDFFADKTATVTGFVTPDTSDPENVFFLARFVVACCAVDAQPVGIPVYYPGWQDEYPIDSWVSIESGFDTNPSISSEEAIALVPSEITPTDQPAEPYVY